MKHARPMKPHDAVIRLDGTIVAHRRDAHQITAVVEPHHEDDLVCSLCAIYAHERGPEAVSDLLDLVEHVLEEQH